MCSVCNRLFSLKLGFYGNPEVVPFKRRYVLVYKKNKTNFWFLSTFYSTISDLYHPLVYDFAFTLWITYTFSMNPCLAIDYVLIYCNQILNFIKIFAQSSPVSEVDSSTCKCSKMSNLYTIWALSWQNLSSGFLKKRDSNQSPQLQRLDRKLKFRLWQA